MSSSRRLAWGTVRGGCFLFVVQQRVGRGIDGGLGRGCIMVITNITNAWPFSRGVITTVGGKSIYKSGVDERAGIGVWVYIEDRFWGSVSFFLVHVLACFSQLCFYDSFLVWTGIALEHHLGGWGLRGGQFLHRAVYDHVSCVLF